MRLFSQKDVEEGRLSVALLFSIGLVQVAAYYFSAALVNGAGSLAIPQPDTLLYCQAARRIAEGHAFSFSAGTAVSTGTTSVLYPFSLAGLYALGMTGGALVTAGFWLNAAFYLVFLLGWGMAFRRWLSPTVALYADVLLALFPPVAYCALAQSDAGFWMAVSALFVAGLATGRRRLYQLMLLIGPWVRPEGALLVGSLFLMSVVLRNRRLFADACLGAFSMAGVFLLNALLTGEQGFSSVAAKGYFSTRPFVEAVQASASDVLSMTRALFLGLATSAPRGLYGVPLVSGLAVLCGALVFDWKRHDVSTGSMSVAALGSFGLVATSGWQGTNMDRYLVWWMPLIILFSATGYAWMRDRWRRYPASVAFVLIPLAFSAIASVCSVCTFHLASAESDQLSLFAKELNRLLPIKSSIGSVGCSGIAYWLEDRRVANIGGIYSPELRSKDVEEAVEILKNEPNTRFDHWIFSTREAFPESFRKLQKAPMLIGPELREVRAARWLALDAAARVPAVSNRVLKCRVDVGYAKDEKAANYEIVPAYGMNPFDKLFFVSDLYGEVAVDCGYLVMGADEMDVSGLEPGRDVTIVLRTCDKVDGSMSDPYGKCFRGTFSFGGKMGLHLWVDGHEVACTHAHIGREGFSDIRLTLRGKNITSSRHRIRFDGDHPAFCYWFFQ